MLGKVRKERQLSFYFNIFFLFLELCGCTAGLVKNLAMLGEESNVLIFIFSSLSL